MLMPNKKDKDNSVKDARNKEVLSVSLGRDPVSLQAVPGRHSATANMNFNCQVILNDINKGGHNQSNFQALQEKCGNGSEVNIHRCGSKRCAFQNKFSPKDRVVSSCTHRTYDCVVPDGTIYINCHSSNVIYLITCCNCGLQYVGETCQKLNERFNWHNTCFNNPKKYSFCKILNSHFNSGLCKDATYEVQILEKLEGSGRTDRNAMDMGAKPLRKSRELFWMLKLRTVYPYGLNDRVGDEWKKDDTHDTVAKRFPRLERKHARNSRGKNRYGNSNMNPKSFLIKLKNTLISNIKDAANFIRFTLSSIKKTDLKIIYSLLESEISNSNNSQFSQWYLMALDLITSKLYKPIKTIIKNKKPDNICSVFFHNKGVELLRLPQILNTKSLSDKIPKCVESFPIPLVTYKLQPSISSKIFNFNKFVSTLDLNAFINNPNILPCNCANSKFKDAYHQHIITGDLSIVENKDLKSLLLKGPKYRENKTLNFDKAKECVMTGVQNCVKDWCIKNKVKEEVMNDWVFNVSELVDVKIQQLKSKNYPKVKEKLKDQNVIQALNSLHNQYVLVPIDKATGNVAIICQQYYARVLAQELGLLGPGNHTYKSINNVSSDIIIKNTLHDLNKKFAFDNVPDEQHCLPNMYWLPKKHKNPSKARFIVAAPKCTVKPLSKAITAIFKMFYKKIEAYNDKSRFFSGVNTFWVVQSNKAVTKNLRNLNRYGKAKSISTFDFSTLYTKIPHDKLLEVLYSIIDFCFDGTDKKFINVTNWGASFVLKKVNKTCFTKQKVKDAVKYLLSHCFFTVGKNVFQQIIGIPMGSDPAPFFANLFLYHYERKWLLELKKNDLVSARKFGNTFRFIDDLNVINDGGYFSQHFHEIYPQEMELSKENHGEVSASFLDLDIEIKENKFHFGLYDKRDAFPFAIVRMPFKSSNMPSFMFYSTASAEVLRIARASTDRFKFTAESCNFIDRMIKQGAYVERLQNTIAKVYRNHVEDFDHLVNSGKDLVSLLFTN